MHRASDRATYLVRKLHDTEREFAKTKRVTDLTEVIKLSKETKGFIKTMRVEPERQGIPIGQRWN